jgi:hypothetical protein
MWLGRPISCHGDATRPTDCHGRRHTHLDPDLGGCIDTYGYRTQKRSCKAPYGGSIPPAASTWCLCWGERFVDGADHAMEMGGDFPVALGRDVGIASDHGGGMATVRRYRAALLIGIDFGR